MLLALTACGGGGGDGGGSSSPSLNFRPLSLSALASEFGEPDHANNYGLSLIEADGEKAKNYDGTDSILGIMDSIVYTNTPELQGQNIRSLGAERGALEPQSATESSHGTAVASVMIGKQDDSGIRGVAPNAELLTYALSLGSSSRIYTPITLHIGDHLATEMQAFIDEDADAVNLSLGYPGLITSYTKGDVEAAFSQTIETMAQECKPKPCQPGRKTVFVIAAGNAHGKPCRDNNPHDNPLCPGITHVVGGETVVDAASPSILSGLPLYFEELRGHVIAVAAVDKDKNIASFSNRCGADSKTWCIAAPGVDIALASGNQIEPYTVSNGTSFAAPFVTGALGVILQYFRDQGMAPTGATARMLETADKTFDGYTEEIYGAGILSIENALQPAGMTTFARAGFSAPLPLSSAVVHLPYSAGDALMHSPATLTFFDSLGAAFRAPLRYFVRASRQTTLSPTNNTPYKVAQRTHRLSARTLLTHDVHIEQPITSIPSTTVNPYLGLLATATTIHHRRATRYGTVHVAVAAASPPIGNIGNIGNVGNVGKPHNELQWGSFLHWTPVPSVSAQLGYIDEGTPWLGGSSHGALAIEAQHTVYGNLNIHKPIWRNWHMLARGFMGRSTALPQARTIIETVTPLITTSFSLSLYRRALFNQKDHLRLSLRQPLRIEQGALNLHYGTWRNRESITYSRQTLSLTPSAREQRASIAYTTPMSLKNSALTLAIDYIKSPHHSRYTKNAAQGTIDIAPRFLIQIIHPQLIRPSKFHQKMSSATNKAKKECKRHGHWGAISLVAVIAVGIFLPTDGDLHKEIHSRIDTTLGHETIQAFITPLSNVFNTEATPNPTT